MTTVRELTNRHRAQQLVLGRNTQAAVKQLWPLLDWTRLDDTFNDLAEPTRTLVLRNRRDSNALASAYLKAARSAAGVKGPQKITFADPLDSAQFAASLQATSIAALKTASKNGVERNLALSNALSMTQGSMSRLVLDGGRQTIAQTSVVDRSIQGWVRVGVGECDWCEQFLDGEVRTVAYDFPAHDNCQCVAEVAF